MTNYTITAVSEYGTTREITVAAESEQAALSSAGVGTGYSPNGFWAVTSVTQE